MRYEKISKRFAYSIWLLLTVVFIGCDDLDHGQFIPENPSQHSFDTEHSASSRSVIAQPTSAVRVRQEPSPSGLLRVFFFDVGQGDATLLIGPDFTILVDAGRHDRNDVVSHLRSAGIEQLDLLVGTHPHSDHIGQFAQVLSNYPVREVWLSGDQHTSRTFERAIDAVLSSNAGYHEPRAGEVFQIGSARVEVINPTRLTGDFHEGCIGLRVVYGDVAFLLAGDIEAPIERQMIEMGLPLKAQILKLGHHGSRTSTTDAFVRVVQPMVGIYSAGAGNSYGHPHQSVLRLLHDYDIPVYGTDRDGTIVVVTDGRQFQVDTAQAVPSLAQDTSGNTININTASPNELLQLPHMTPQRVEELLELRPFRRWEELTQIHGLGPVRVSEIQKQGRARLE